MAQSTNEPPHVPPLGLVDNHPLPPNVSENRTLVHSTSAEARNIASGTVDSIDVEDESAIPINQPNNGVQRPRTLSPVYICVPATFLTLFIIFAGTLAGAIVSWHQYEVRLCILNIIEIIFRFTNILSFRDCACMTHGSLDHA